MEDVIVCTVNIDLNEIDVRNPFGLEKVRQMDGVVRWFKRRQRRFLRYVSYRGQSVLALLTNLGRSKVCDAGSGVTSPKIPALFPNKAGDVFDLRIALQAPQAFDLFYIRIKSEGL